jgi:glycosyltransferase involved in cell wall biosynthesis
MKIMYDHQVFSFQRVGGISRYFCEIAQNLPADIEYNISGIYSNNLYLEESFNGKFCHFFPNNTFKGKDRIVDIPNKIDSIIQCAKGKYDIFHPTYYDPYFLKINKKPFVLTIHDMIHEKFAEYLNKENKIVEFKKGLAYKADHIIAVSNNTKNDILQYYDRINPDKISVIYHGNSLIYKEDINSIKTIKNYLLYTGERTRYKNFYKFIDAVSDLLIDHDIDLVCTGSKFTQSELSLFKQKKISLHVHNIYVKDSEMFSLYRNALAFIFPSLYEGFGIPILEAFAAECPVVLSNSSCFPEIAGDGGAYFDPNDIDSIKTEVENVIIDSDLRTGLINKGNERIKLFNWKNSADETAKVYRSLI